MIWKTRPLAPALTAPGVSIWQILITAYVLSHERSNLQYINGHCEMAVQERHQVPTENKLHHGKLDGSSRKSA